MGPPWSFYGDLEKTLVITVNEHAGRLRVCRGDAEERLGPKPSRLLRHFLDHPGIPFTVDQLDKAVWDEDEPHDPKSVHNHLRSLREALNGTDRDNYFFQKGDRGYQFLNGPEDFVDPSEQHHSNKEPSQRATDFVAKPLPALGYFVGREDDFTTALNRWMSARESPLLIWGPAGIGKSTLALALLLDPESLQRFGPRRYRLRCDGLDSAAAVRAAMGREWFGLDPADNRVFECLHEAQAACVLDNFETPHGKDPVESEVLLRILIGLGTVWLIVSAQGFYKPASIRWSQPLEPSRLSLEDSCRLFSLITGYKEHGDDPRLRPVLELFDGVPHAIELLAHQAENRPDLTQLIARWEQDGVPLLRRMGGHSRETSLAVSYEFALSNPQIDDGTKQLLRRMAFLPGGVYDGELKDLAAGIDLQSPLSAMAELIRAALAYRDNNRIRVLSPLANYLRRAHQPTNFEVLHLYEYYLNMAVPKWARPEGGPKEDLRTLLTRDNIDLVNVFWSVREAVDSREPRGILGALSLVSVGVSAKDCIPILQSAQMLARDIGESLLQAMCFQRIGGKEMELAREKGDGDYGAARHAYERALELFRAVMQGPALILKQYRVPTYYEYFIADHSLRDRPDWDSSLLDLAPDRQLDECRETLDKISNAEKLHAIAIGVSKTLERARIDSGIGRELSFEFEDRTGSGRGFFNIRFANPELGRIGTIFLAYDLNRLRVRTDVDGDCYEIMLGTYFDHPPTDANVRQRVDLFNPVCKPALLYIAQTYPNASFLVGHLRWPELPGSLLSGAFEASGL